MKYRREIDGLRSIAVIPVILFHAGFTSFSGGYVGVDIFFVISGYLITSIIVGDLENGTFSITNFYVRRIRRILPVLVVVIIFTLPFAWAWMLPLQFEEFSRSLVFVSLFVSNYFFKREVGYFDSDSDYSPLLHTWSLAIEEQYYVIFPVFLLLAWRLGKNRVFSILIIFSILSLLFSEFGWRTSPNNNFYSTPARAWEILAGAISALLWINNSRKPNDIVSGFGFSCIIFSIFYFDDNTPFPSIYTLIPVLGTSLIILYGTKGTLVAKLLSTKMLVGIGLISYSAYLWHQPLFAFARIRSLYEPDKWIFLTLVVATFSLAFLSWKFIEQPFRKNRVTFFQPKLRVFSTSSLFASGIIIFGIYSQTPDVSGKRFDLTSSQIEYISTSNSSPKRNACHTSGWEYLEPSLACSYFSKNVRIAVLGDSHSVELAYALAIALEPEGIGVQQLTFSSCFPTYETETFSNACAEWTQEAIRWILENDDITDVVMSYRIHAALNGNHERIYPELPGENSDAYRFEIISSLEKILFDLSQTKNVIYVAQAPEVAATFEKLVYWTPSNQTDQLIGISREWWSKRTQFFDENMRNMVASMAPIVDISTVLCDGEYCYAGSNGISYYFDDDHLSIEGALMVVEEILPLLTKMQQ